MKYNDRGEELPDDTPMELKVKFRRPPSIQELIAMHVKAQMQVESKMGKEDEDDFDEHDETDDVLTPYEIDAYAGEAHAELRKAEATKKVLDRLAENRYSRGSSTSGGKDGLREDEKGVGRFGQSGKADNGVNKPGPEVASAGKESKERVADE